MDMLFDGKSALRDYHMNLLSCKITPPVRKTYPINVPGADGEIDAAEGMYPARYEMRTITATFAPSGRPLTDTVSALINALEGRTVEVILPGDAEHYMSGTVHVVGAGGMVAPEIMLTILCMPWKYAAQEREYTVPASATERTYTLVNGGTREAVPTLELSGDATITFDGSTYTISAGKYMMTELTISGNGSITVGIKGKSAKIRYREAIL